MSDEGPIQRLAPALEPLTKGLAPGQPLRRKTAAECAETRTGLRRIPCAICGAADLELCKL